VSSTQHNVGFPDMQNAVKMEAPTQISKKVLGGQAMCGLIKTPEGSP
jgi:hypothetical protein